MEILDPTTEAVTQTIAWAPRPASLSGKKVALMQSGGNISPDQLRDILDRGVESAPEAGSG